MKADEGSGMIATPLGLMTPDGSRFGCETVELEKCKVPGCENLRWKQYKKCRFHIEHRDLTKLCPYEGCDIWIKETSIGCQGHWHRIKQQEETPPIPPVNGGELKMCTVEDCRGIVKSGDVCDYHHEHPTLTVRCLREGCCQWIEDDQSFCGNHGARRKRNGKL